MRHQSSYRSRPHSLLILAAVLAFASSAAPLFAQENSAPTGYTVRGTVLDAVSGQPLARALVELNQEFAILTDGEGQFSIPGVSAGGYMVTVRKPGYWSIGQPTNGGFHPGMPPPFHPPQAISIGPNQASFSFRLTPLAVITGHITLSTADPADDIVVTAYTRRVENGRMRWTTAGTARTRSDGSYRIAGLVPGSYMVYTQVTRDRPASSANSVAVWGYPPAYYPGVTDPSAAGMIVLRAGQQARADLTLVRQQFFPVTAVVQAPPDAFPNFEILDSSGRRTGMGASYDRRNGTVRASVPSGSWSLEAHAFGREPLWGRSDFHVTGAPTGVTLSLSPLPHIPVNIRRDFAASAEDSQPRISGPGINLFLASTDDFSLNPYGGGLNSVEGSNGQSWELRIMEPGRYWVQATAFPPAYIISITSGGVDLASNPLLIVPGSDPAPIDITLRNDGGTITGTLTGLPTATSGSVNSAGLQQRQTWIYAIPLFPSASTVPAGFVMPGGQFTLSGLAPGSYRVIASDTPQEIDFRSADSLAAWSGKGETVSVDAGGTAHVELSVLSPEAAQ